jgi:hypothetical protein
MEASDLQVTFLHSKHLGLRTWDTDVGGFQSKTSLTLLGSTVIPSGDIYNIPEVQKHHLYSKRLWKVLHSIKFSNFL